MDKSSRFHGKTPRVALAAALVTGMLSMFAAFGGIGIAQGAISAAQYAYGKDRVAVCHKGKTITVSKKAVPAHLRHGDTVGACAGTVAKAKAEKAKAKAEHEKAEHAKPEHAKPEHAKPEHAKADKVKPEKAKAEHGKPEKAESEHGKPEKTEHGKPDKGGKGK